MSKRYDFSVLGVMVIDDNHYMLQIVKTILNGMRIKDIHNFTSPVEALADLENWHPDVIFVDWMMDPVNGLEFVQLIRQSESPIRFVPLILLTGHADRQLVRRARDKGADYTLSKPVSLNAFQRTFVRLIERPRHFVQTPTYFGPNRRRRNLPFDGPDRRVNPDPVNAGEHRLPHGGYRSPQRG